MKTPTYQPAPFKELNIVKITMHLEDKSSETFELEFRSKTFNGSKWGGKSLRKARSTVAQQSSSKD